MKNLRRRQGQGMTEYIVIVGLIAILLIGAVRKFSHQIDVTIQGSAGEVENKVTNGMTEPGDTPGDDQPPPAPVRSGTTSNNLPYRSTSGGGYEVMVGGTWVPHNPADHGTIN